MESSDIGVVERASTSNVAFRKLATSLLLIVGIEFWLVLGKGDYGAPRQWWAIGIALLFSVIPQVRRWVTNQLDRLRSFSQRTRHWIALAITILSMLFFLFTAHQQGRVMRLKYLDEQSYAIGMQMAARGHLWMHEHPAADFFEALELIVHPVYASMYFPGTAMLFAPSVWLGLSFWIWAAMLAGISVGLSFLITAELVDPVAGLLCVLILIGSSIFRLVSVMLLSQIPALLLILLVIHAWLRWRQRPHWGWALLIGIFGGWCAITRPLDAAALLLPLLIAILIESRRASTGLLKTSAAIGAGALPFLAIQLIFNIGVTGSLLITPFQVSQERDYPQTSLGFHRFDPTIKPASTLPQKLRHYEHFTEQDVKTHQLSTAVHSMLYEWLPRLLRSGLPSPLLLLLVPCGLLMAATKGRWILLISLPIWVMLYSLYVFQLEHYIITLLPLIALAIVGGMEQIRMTWPTLRMQLTTFLTLFIAGLCLAALPEFNPKLRDEFGHFDDLTTIDKALESVTRPAVVLFKDNPALSAEVEPVYNSSVAWPDDAVVIRAHDLGARDVELFHYYAQIQPNRSIYLYDRNDGSLRLLGTAKELAHAN